ncbi:hypothetical protein IEQ34_007123 [Dendrobium chrysotoxum]|uniref:Uncharacterized protein n=1 Tax=Dendrobium chrysotoxum TaxID=161865 RepID=A0AAV7H5W6_DENCH|nr:hypothetical protein IEQ34_007123 [Dendrobium chrysotoxum]
MEFYSRYSDRAKNETERLNNFFFFFGTGVSTRCHLYRRSIVALGVPDHARPPTQQSPMGWLNKLDLDGLEMDEEERYNHKLEAGLYTLQLIVVILVHLRSSEHQ